MLQSVPFQYHRELFNLYTAGLKRNLRTEQEQQKQQLEMERQQLGEAEDQCQEKQVVKRKIAKNERDRSNSRPKTATKLSPGKK